jgi:hypothetical protein
VLFASVSGISGLQYKKMSQFCRNLKLKRAKIAKNTKNHIFQLIDLNAFYLPWWRNW